MDLKLKGLKQHQLFEPLFCPIPAPGQGHCHGNGQGQGHAPLEQLQPPPPLTPFFLIASLPIQALTYSNNL